MCPLSAQKATLSGIPEIFDFLDIATIAAKLFLRPLSIAAIALALYGQDRVFSDFGLAKVS